MVSSTSYPFPQNISCYKAGATCNTTILLFPSSVPLSAPLKQVNMSFLHAFICRLISLFPLSQQPNPPVSHQQPPYPMSLPAPQTTPSRPPLMTSPNSTTLILWLHSSIPPCCAAF
ncbi:hypothetical protein BDN70DRAFT_490678 [Pholiota conissans]|uniref:Uncharacterized protein n=1 Tax=Pholiota conissans TaxID=109636 RepID=A0A9P5YM04_9AGAR|nr:hypothetical protein BDN70DRAFT_490678 [Pholiota conissans]